MSESETTRKSAAKASGPAARPAAPSPARKPVTRPAPRAEVAVAAAPVVEAAVAPPAEAAEMIEAVMSPAVESDPVQAEPAVLAAATEEGIETMATINPGETAGFTAEKFQSLFGDMGQRFKTSFEKSAKLGEEMVDLTKGNVEAVVASARVAAKAGEQLGQEAADYSKQSFETAIAAMKSFASVKSPTELFQLQSDYARASFDSAVAQASKLSESMLKLAGEVTQPLSSRYAVAAEKIKAASL